MTIDATATPRSVLEPLFEKAKATDEFEFACALVRHSGMQGAGWQPLIESEALLTDMLDLTKAPLLSATKVRLALLMYCHATEMSFPYDVIGNMLRICAGDRQKLDVCDFHHGRDAYPRDKIKLIKGWADEQGFPTVGTIFDRFFENRIRNAFYHSEYVLHGDRLNLTSGKGISVNGQITTSVPIHDELLPRVNAALAFVFDVIHLVIDSIRSYKEAKIVRGRAAADGSHMDVTLDADPKHGLVGFSGVSGWTEKTTPAALSVPAKGP